MHMCDAKNAAIWTLLIVSALVSAYQIYLLVQAGQTGTLVYLGYVAYAMPVLALVLYAIPRVRWTSVIVAAVGVALSNSVALAAFIALYVLEISGKA